MTTNVLPIIISMSSNFREAIQTTTIRVRKTAVIEMKAAVDTQEIVSEVYATDAMQRLNNRKCSTAISFLWLSCFTCANVACAVGDDSEVSDYFKIAIENAIAIRNYDVIVTEWNAYFCKNAEDARNFPGLEEKIVYRLVADREDEHFFHLRMRRGFVEGNAEGVDFLRAPPWELSQYVNGKGLIRHLGKVGEKDQIRNLPLEKFLPTARIPAVEMASIFAYPTYWVKPPTEMIENAVRGNSKGSIKQLPDGTKLVQIVVPSNGTPYRSFVVDPKTLIPSRLSKWKTTDGKSEVYFSQTVELEEVNTIFRPLSLTLEQDRMWSTKQNKIIPLSQVGTVSFEWIQVNVDNLQFPDLAVLGHDIVQWASFLKIDQNTLANDEKKASRK